MMGREADAVRSKTYSFVCPSMFLLARENPAQAILLLCYAHCDRLCLWQDSPADIPRQQ